MESKADYDLYCHYVAGLVGIGLSQLFAHSRLEGTNLIEQALFLRRRFRVVSFILFRESKSKHMIASITHAFVYTDESFFRMESISNNMGLFLQRTNIIRDYLDDINHQRVFWPKEVWYVVMCSHCLWGVCML